MLIFKEFDVEEQNAVNRAALNEDLSAYTKEDMIEELDFIMASSDDKDVIDLYKRTRAKISVIDRKDWRIFLSGLPFKTPYSSESSEYEEE